VSVLLTPVTSNVCGNPLRAKAAVRRRIRRAAQVPGANKVNFGQEIAGSNRFRIPPHSGSYADLWREVMAHHGRVTFGYPHEVPVSVPEHWRVTHHETRKLHGGRRKVSPARYATVVCAEVDGFKVAFICCHTVSKPRPGVRQARWRMDRFAEYLHQLSGIVAHWHQQGHTVIFGGDMNHRAKGLPAIHPDQRVLIQSGLDHLWVVEAKGHKVTRIRAKKIHRTALMDHPILYATVKVEAR
jgi:hypothetical protein